MSQTELFFVSYLVELCDVVRPEAPHVHGPLVVGVALVHASVALEWTQINRINIKD